MISIQISPADLPFFLSPPPPIYRLTFTTVRPMTLFRIILFVREFSP